MVRYIIYEPREGLNSKLRLRLHPQKCGVKILFGGIYMAMWNPWRGCHKHSEGCRYCYIHKGDFKRGIDTINIVKTNNFYAPIAKNKSGSYKMKSGQTVYLCFSTDFLVEDADEWRSECWQMIRERSDLHFLF